MRLAAVIGSVAAACAGCGDNNAAAPDAPVDAMPDAMPDPICAGTDLLEGDVIDFGWTPGMPLGVSNAILRLRDEPACWTHTAPEGWFNMMLPTTGGIIDLDNPGDYLDGLMDLRGTLDVLEDWGLRFRARGLTTERANTLNAALGQTYDPTRGQVMVYQAFQLTRFTLTGTNGIVVSMVNQWGTWAPYNGGLYTLFTNVEVGTGTQDLSAEGAWPCYGTGSVPVEAGKVTYVTTAYSVPI